MDQRYAAVGETPPKKKRGRPKKTETVLVTGEASALGMKTTTAADHAKFRKPRVSQREASPSTNESSRSMVGQSVHGVVDGSFDAGYLVTVRVADSDTVYRGVVFGPGLSIPLNRGNDVAPMVKNANREDVPLSPVVPSSPQPAAAPAPSEAAPMAGYSPSPAAGALSGYGSAPSAFRSSFDQDVLNAGGLMYPGVSSQLHPNHAFFPRGFGYQFHLPGTEYAPANAPFETDAQGAPARPRS